MSESKSNQPTLGEVQDLVRVFSRQGKPEKGAKLITLFNAGEPIPYELLDPAGKVRSENPVEGKLQMPARSGRGSGQPKWMDFAMKVSDFDEAILSKLTRDEIIELLEDREIIESEGESEGDSEESGVSSSEEQASDKGTSEEASSESGFLGRIRKGARDGKDDSNESEESDPDESEKSEK